MNKITLKLNTNLFNCLDFSLYESNLEIDTSSIAYDFDELVNAGLINENFDIYKNTKFDHKNHKKDLAKFGIDYINENLDKSILPFKTLNLKNGTIWSPKFYNFETDQLDFDLEIDFNWIEAIKKEFSKNNNNQYKLFIDYAKENFCSHSGFISFAPIPENNQSFHNYIDETAKNDKLELFLGMYLSFIFIDNGLDQDDFENDYFNEIKCNNTYFENPVIDELYYTLITTE